MTCRGWYDGLILEVNWSKRRLGNAGADIVGFGFGLDFCGNFALFNQGPLHESYIKTNECVDS